MSASGHWGGAGCWGGGSAGAAGGGGGGGGGVGGFGEFGELFSPGRVLFIDAGAVLAVLTL